MPIFDLLNVFVILPDIFPVLRLKSDPKTFTNSKILSVRILLQGPQSTQSALMLKWQVGRVPYA